MKRLLQWLNKISERILEALIYMGGLVQLMSQVLTRMWQRPFAIRTLIHQLESVGIESIGIAVLTALFSSMVLTVQLAVQLGLFGAKGLVSKVISVSFVPELGPVLTGLMVGGRVGAGITAELGSMSVTEQIDAMRSMGADPVRKLVIPRIVATVMILPLLSTLANILGILGATLIGWLNLQISPWYFLNQAIDAVTLENFFSGLIKSLFFGFFISLIACYQGLRTKGSTEQVGESTTKTVVIVSIVTLLTDFILTNLLIGLGF